MTLVSAFWRIYLGYPLIYLLVGWILLALSVALVNAGSGLTALYILLACVGWTLLLLFPVKMALFWLARKTGSSESTV